MTVVSSFWQRVNLDQWQFLVVVIWSWKLRRLPGSSPITSKPLFRLCSIHLRAVPTTSRIWSTVWLTHRYYWFWIPVEVCQLLWGYSREHGSIPFLYILNVRLCQTSSGIWLQIIGTFISANRSIHHCWCWSNVENQMWPSTTALALLCGVLIDGLHRFVHLIPCAIINWVTRSTIVCIDMRRRLHSIHCILSQVWTSEVVTTWWDA